MTKSDGSRPIIIKKVIKKGGHGHHGGAWKVAYADFVTAMMAFFLLMWLLNVTTDDEKLQISNYFQQSLGIFDMTSSAPEGQQGFLGGQGIADEMTTETDFNSESVPQKALVESPQSSHGDAGIGTGPKDDELKNQSETPPSKETVVVAEDVPPPPSHDGSTHDTPNGRDSHDQGTGQGPEKGFGQGQDKGDGRGDRLDSGLVPQTGVRHEGTAGNPFSKEQSPLPFSEISEVVREKIVQEHQRKTYEEVKQKLMQALQSIPDLQALSGNLMIDQTPEGLRIQIVDKDTYALFPKGSSKMYDYTARILQEIGRVIAKLPNKISLSGHTDTTPFVNADQYSNWNLSFDRANESRKVLVAAGVDPGHIGAVVGKASVEPLLEDAPNAPQNRRISIVLLREPSDSGASGSEKAVSTQ